MKIEGGHIINDFIEPNKRQYIIPVYQRNYEWSRDDCVKLYEDVVQSHKRDTNHFCGSIIYAPLKEEHNIHYYVIVDGQQRLTTIFLLIKALIDCAKTDKEKEYLSESLFNKDKFDDYDIDVASKLKLKPIKSDNQQLLSLMNNNVDNIDKSSYIWINYVIFKEQIQKTLNDDPDIDVKSIYHGLEKLICAEVKLDEDDNAQEIFESINSTGVPLSLADIIRNYVLMTDANQEELYEDYWLQIENLIDRGRMSEFFLDYLNMKSESYVTEKNAYDTFKEIFTGDKYTHESMLKELYHYAKQYHTFLYGDPNLPKAVNESLNGLHLLKQTTCFLFLFHVFDDYECKVIDDSVLTKITKFILTYSIRRTICNIPSNSLRGLYKFLYRRVFSDESLKAHYYDAIVSFMQQMTSRDSIPGDRDFSLALKNNDLYGKKALCRYLLISIENPDGSKEKIVTDQLSIEHIMPQNKNLSQAWKTMLGDDWVRVHEQWLNTLGNLTLTGYNSELGDRPFEEKLKFFDDNPTRIKELNKDVVNQKNWDESTIKKRADRLANIVIKKYPVPESEVTITFTDPKFKEYSCEDPENAKFKTVRYYELLGERVNVTSYAEMVRSVARRLYDIDSSIIERMARNNETFPGWTSIAFSYDSDKVRGNKQKIADTEIYIASGFSAPDCILFIRNMLNNYDIDPNNDFVYSARQPDDNNG